MKTSDVEEIRDQQRKPDELHGIVQIFHVCVKEQNAVKPHDAIGRKEEEPELMEVC